MMTSTLNAGIMAVSPGTEQGYETQFRTNHINHALLTKLLLPTLLKTTKELFTRLLGGKPRE
jgi:NAD(P)-dependent dehydrogenase (short-subunit alcohol dehydrogenase family)